MKIKGKQIASGTITQSQLSISTNSITGSTHITNKQYVDVAVNSAMTLFTNSTANLNMAALVTVTGTGYQLACNSAITEVPYSMVTVMVNGLEVNVGSGLTCAFSPDGGVTLRDIGDGQMNDYLYWNTDLGVYLLDTADVIDFFYIIKKPIV